MKQLYRADLLQVKTRIDQGIVHPNSRSQTCLFTPARPAAELLCFAQKLPSVVSRAESSTQNQNWER